MALGRGMTNAGELGSTAKHRPAQGRAAHGQLTAHCFHTHFCLQADRVAPPSPPPPLPYNLPILESLHQHAESSGRQPRRPPPCPLAMLIWESKLTMNPIMEPNCRTTRLHILTRSLGKSRSSPNTSARRRASKKCHPNVRPRLPKPRDQSL